MFLGEHQHSLDAKGRVILPARFRDQLEDGAVMARSLSRSARTASAAAANDRTSFFVAYRGEALAGAAFSGGAFTDSLSVEPFVDPFCASGTDVSSESSARS